MIYHLQSGCPFHTCYNCPLIFMCYPKDEDYKKLKNI